MRINIILNILPYFVLSNPGLCNARGRLPPGASGEIGWRQAGRGQSNFRNGAKSALLIVREALGKPATRRDRSRTRPRWSSRRWAKCFAPYWHPVCTCAPCRLSRFAPYLHPARTGDALSSLPQRPFLSLLWEAPCHLYLYTFTCMHTCRLTVHPLVDVWRSKPCRFETKASKSVTLMRTCVRHSQTASSKVIDCTSGPL